jgi:hypothetical protein
MVLMTASYYCFLLLVRALYKSPQNHKKLSYCGFHYLLSYAPFLPPMLSHALADAFSKPLPLQLALPAQALSAGGCQC